MKNLLRDILTTVSFFVLSWLTYRLGVLILAVPLALAGLGMRGFIGYVLFWPGRKRNECVAAAIPPRRAGPRCAGVPSGIAGPLRALTIACQKVEKAKRLFLDIGNYFNVK